MTDAVGIEPASCDSWHCCAGGSAGGSDRAGRL